MNAESRKSLGISALTSFVSVASVLGWFGISPQAAGEAAYGFLHWFLPVATLAFGTVAGWNACRFFAEREDVDARKAMAVRFAELDFGDKATAVAAHDEGFVSCGGETSHRMWENGRLREFMRRDSLELGKARWYLKDEARKMMDENPWCAESVRETMERKRAERGYQVAHDDEELLEIITQQWKGLDAESEWFGNPRDAQGGEPS